MKVLVVDEAATAGSTAKLLDGMDVLTARFRDAASVASRAAVDVVLTAWPAHCARPEEFIAALRAAQPEYTAIVIVNSTDQQQAGAAFHAGVDDCVRYTASREELLARVRRAGRLAALERLASRPAPSAPARILGRIQTLGGWSRYGSLSADTLSQLCGVPMTIVGSLADFLPTFAAEIRIAAPVDRLEMPLVIEAESAALEALGESMFGERITTAAQIDLLLEMANTVSGAFVRCALESNTELTMGLPVALSVEQASRRIQAVEAKQSVYLTTADGSIRLRISIGARSRENIFIPVTKLRDGMVLSRDLRTSRGILVAKAGTRVSGTQAERLVALLGPAVVLEVADAAA